MKYQYQDSPNIWFSLSYPKHRLMFTVAEARSESGNDTVDTIIRKIGREYFIVGFFELFINPIILRLFNHDIIYNLSSIIC